MKGLAQGVDLRLVISVWSGVILKVARVLKIRTADESQKLETRVNACPVLTGMESQTGKN